MTDPNDEFNGYRLAERLCGIGIATTVTRTRFSSYVVTATDDKQNYRLTGDQLYPLVVELARRAGVEDMD